MKDRFTNKFTGIIVLVFSVIVCLSFTACANNNSTSYVDKGTPSGIKHFDGYQLMQSTILARHNLRAPVTDGGSDLSKMTTHEWFKWTADSGGLSHKGGELEAIMGQYFNKYYASENFLPENWEPQGNEAYIYSNSYERTIATANYFVSGMMPTSNIDVFYKPESNKRDPVFFTTLPEVSDSFKAQVLKELDDHFGEGGTVEINRDLDESYKLLEKVLDFKNSEYAKEHNITEFPREDVEISFKPGYSAGAVGPIVKAMDAADALCVQYLEEENDAKADWGNNLSFEQWKKIHRIYDAYIYSMVASKTASLKSSMYLLKELSKDINVEGRKFNFLCGHDTTISTALSALDAESIELPNSIAGILPMGSMLVFNKYKNAQDEEFGSVSIVYQTTDQLRHRLPLSLDNPPEEHQVEINGLNKNQDGLYKWSDIQGKISSAVAVGESLS